eukprot:7464703-Lingulodinium_polyedra.AAC.1
MPQPRLSPIAKVRMTLQQAPAPVAPRAPPIPRAPATIPPAHLLPMQPIGQIRPKVRPPVPR